MITKKETYPELGQKTDGVPTTILDQRSRDHFHRLSNGLERPTLDAFNRLGLVGKSNRNRHLGCSTTRSQAWIKDHITGNGHRIGQISIDLVQNIF